MVTRDSSPPNAPRLRDRITAIGRRSFVGRNTERDLFRQALRGAEPPFAVLHVHGPGGVGKTALLGEFARLAADEELPVIRLDGRDVEASPSGFLFALGHALGTTEAGSPLECLAAYPRGVLLIDTYEQLTPLDAWLREKFLPQLPSGFVVVIAGRNAPATAWRTDPGWRDLVQIIALRNLRPEESRAYLDERGIPAARHQEVLAFTYGHPLALALVSDVLTRGQQQTEFPLRDDPDIVQTLLERFVRQIPSQLHRDALEVCAHTRVTTEALLAAVLGEEHAPELFAWLRGLSFVEQGPQGLFPHDLARDVLDADLRWRNPADYRDLHRRVRGYVLQTLRESSGRQQQRAAFDLLFLHRGNPVIRPIHDWDALTAGYAEPATPADLPAILEIVRRHEGPRSAEIAAYWAERQPGGFHVCRDTAGEVSGFVANVVVREAPPADRAADPALASALAFAARYGPLRPGDEIVLHRFAMGRDTYQAVSATMNLMAMNCVLHWVGNPRLAWSFMTTGEPDLWHRVFLHINQRRSPEADFTVGDRTYSVYTHDWRTEPAPVWLDVMSERELATDVAPETPEPERPRPLLVLSEPEFAAAVRQALRDFARPDALAANPLMRSRLTLEAAGGNPDTETLRTRIREAAQQLRANPRDEKLYRAIHYTYLEPLATQELAAERLDLPFSTYRRHLTTGIARITALLWQRELHGCSS